MKESTQVAHVAIAVEEEEFEAYVRAVAKVGVVSSKEAYRSGSPRGEHKAKGMRRTWRQLDTWMESVNEGKKGRRRYTAEATKVDHVLVRTNELDELVGLIGSNGGALQDRV
jgi:hypothetical protein